MTDTRYLYVTMLESDLQKTKEIIGDMEKTIQNLRNTLERHDSIERQNDRIFSGESKDDNR